MSMSLGFLSDYFPTQRLMNRGGQLWRPGVFCLIIFANKAAEMAYLMFASAIATESKVHMSFFNAAFEFSLNHF